MSNQIILIKGTSCVTWEVLEAKGFEIVKNDKRTVYKKDGKFYGYSFPVWKGNCVRLEELKDMSNMIYENLKPEIKKIYDLLEDDGVEQDAMMSDPDNFNQ